MCCKTMHFENNPSFKILEASYNVWEGGQGVKGKKVTIKFNNSDNISFLKLYFQGKEAEVELKEQKESKYLIVNFYEKPKPDLILHHNSLIEKSNTLPNSNEFPFVLENNEAVLLYVEKNKEKYLKINNIKQTETEYFN